MNDEPKEIENAIRQNVPLTAMLGNKNSCTFAGGNETCPTCPRKMTMLYMCGILQDEAARHQDAQA